MQIYDINQGEMLMIPMIIMAMEDDDDRTFMINLYERYYPLMYSRARAIVRDEMTAEDMVQDTVVKLIRNIKKVRALGSPVLPSYLVICIKRTCLDYLRHKKVADAHTGESMDDESLHAEYEDKTMDIEADVLLKLGIEEVKEAFIRLPEQLQDILEYKYLLELDDEEIAKTLGIKKDSVRKYVSRARRATYDLLKEEEDE